MQDGCLSIASAVKQGAARGKHLTRWQWRKGLFQSKPAELIYDKKSAGTKAGMEPTALCAMSHVWVWINEACPTNTPLYTNYKHIYYSLFSLSCYMVALPCLGEMADTDVIAYSWKCYHFILCVYKVLVPQLQIYQAQRNFSEIKWWGLWLW